MISTTQLNKLREYPLAYEAGVFFRDRLSLLKGNKAGTFSQYGEDRFVLDYFTDQSPKRYLDIGASHPYRISNTYLLYKNGWTGITVEPIPRLVALHRKWRPKDELLPVAVGAGQGKLTFYEMTPSVLSTLDPDTADDYVTKGRAQIFRTYDIDVMSIENVMTRAFKKAHVDFVSIDVEGLDAELLDNIDLEKNRPSMFCIEANDDEARAYISKILKNANYKVEREVGDNIIAIPK